MNPNSSCPPEADWLCKPWVEDRSAPSPNKICDTPQIDNRSDFTLTGPPGYGECMCPEGSTYVAQGGGRCVPRFNQTQKPADMCAGNPIQPGTGNKRQTDIDYMGVGIAPLTFARTYNSASTTKQTWTSSFHRTTSWFATSNGATHLFHRPEGSFPFTWNGSAYVPDADVRMRYGSGNLTLDESRRVEHYVSLAPGKIVMDQVRTLNGTVLQTLTYSTTSTSTSIAPYPGLLITISDPFGHALNLTYNSQGQMATMTDPAGGLYQYAYDPNGNLRTVTYPDGAIRTYVYNEPAHTAGANLSHVLTGIIDENNERYATFGYDANGLAVLTEHAGGADRYTVSYASAPSVASQVVLDGSNNVKYVREYYQAPSGATLTDALGKARHYTFTQLNGSIKTTGSDFAGNGSCSSIPQSRSFDANGNQTATTDFNSNITTSSYDLTRNLETSRTEASGTPRARTITTQWHPSYRVPVQIDEPGKRTTYTYDSNGNFQSKIELDTTTGQSRTWTYVYNNYGQILSVNGPRTDVNDVTTYSYYNCTTGYQCGQIHTITDALNHVTTFHTYNAHGQPLTITDGNNVQTTLTYDARQRLTSRTVGGEQSSFSYWPTGLLKRVTLPDSSYVEYTYDAAHRLTGIRDTEGNRIAYTLDAMGNRTAEHVYDALNTPVRSHTREFNTLNQLWKEIGAAGTGAVTTAFGYDANGNQTSINAPLGRNTAQTYDELNRLKEVTDPLLGKSVYGYNALDQLISVTDPKNLQTSYNYNALGDLLQQTSPDTGTTSFTYDLAGHVATKTDARGVWVGRGTYTYDALNRVTQVQYPDHTVSYSYDSCLNGIGRLCGMTDASGSTGYEYDGLGRVTRKTQTVIAAGGSSLTRELRYAYTNGHLAQLTLPEGHTVNYTYDSVGRISSMSLTWANGTVSPILSNVLYDAFGGIRGWTWANGSLTVREYDQDGRVTTVDSAGYANLTYDDAGRIIDTFADGSAPSWSYGYDALDRLTTAERTGLSRTYTYDANGNRKTQGGTETSNYTYSTPLTSNRLQSISGSLNRTYSYDAMGNVTNDGTVSFTYDGAGRMKSAGQTQYRYNGLGQRTQKQPWLSYQISFVYDEAGHLIEKCTKGPTTPCHPYFSTQYLWLDDIPVAALLPHVAYNEEGYVSEFYIGLYNVHTDHLNTPRRLTPSNGTEVVLQWDSDPFGIGMPFIGSVDHPADWDLRLPGQVIDWETGLHYNYFRDYDPATGRYPQSDPTGLRGGLNTYAYARGNPLSYSDPLGLETQPRVVPWWWPTIPGQQSPLERPPGGWVEEEWAKNVGDGLKKIGKLIKRWCLSESEACKQQCDEAYQTQISVCGLLQGKRARQQCYENAMVLYSDCLAKCGRGESPEPGE